jgi:hypothetical protein
LLTGRLDQQVTGSNHPLQNRLLEGNIVDHLERDLLSAPGEDSGSNNQAFVGHDVAGEPPIEIPRQRYDQPHNGEDRQGYPPGRVFDQHEDCDCRRDHCKRDRGWDNDPLPVRPELEMDDFAGTEQTFWIWHGLMVRE